MKIGVLGAGQLGRMLALAGYPLGLEFKFFDTVADAPAGQLAPLVAGRYDDEKALVDFAEGLDVVTYEFENVPVEAVKILEKRVPVYPPILALETAQDRLVEKICFEDNGIPRPRCFGISRYEDFVKAVEWVGLPAIMKTRRFGYDGKGQAVVREIDDFEAVFHALGGQNLILESLVSFEREVSIIAVRSRLGETKFYPLIENYHSRGILQKSIAPAPNLTIKLQSEAEDYARRVLEELEYVGVLAIEFFVKDGGLVANEMAPRVHNSGHWTIEGAETSQFENHLRAVAGLPLGSTEARGVSVMLNLIGVQPNFDELLKLENAHVHWYGKSVRSGRKVGHITLTGETFDDIQNQVSQLENLLIKL